MREEYAWNWLLPERLAQRAQLALRVRGDSMIDDGIEDGDLILIAPQVESVGQLIGDAC